MVPKYGNGRECKLIHTLGSSSAKAMMNTPCNPEIPPLVYSLENFTLVCVCVCVCVCVYTQTHAVGMQGCSCHQNVATIASNITTIRRMRYVAIYSLSWVELCPQKKILFKS